MILVINLEENECIDFNIYKAIEYIWLYDDAVTQYSNIDEVIKNKRKHIDKKGKSFIAIIDTDNKTYEVFDIAEESKWIGS